MTLSVGLAADLNALSEAVDDPDIDIADTMTQLGDAAAAGVESYLGLSVALAGDAAAVQLSTISDQDCDIGSSVLIPLTALTAAMPPTAVISLVLYAATPGAFVDLAADVAWMTGRDISEFRVDQHRTPPAPTSAANSVRAQSAVDQAIGVLIGRGRTPEQAAQDLALLAARDETHVPAAAAAILDELT